MSYAVNIHYLVVRVKPIKGDGLLRVLQPSLKAMARHSAMTNGEEGDKGTSSFVLLRMTTREGTKGGRTPFPCHSEPAKKLAPPCRARNDRGGRGMAKEGSGFAKN